MSDMHAQAGEHTKLMDPRRVIVWLYRPTCCGHKRRKPPTDIHTMRPMSNTTGPSKRVNHHYDNSCLYCQCYVATDDRQFSANVGAGIA